MAKNDFDIDFDFEKEYGFDPKAVLDSEYMDEDLDLSQFDEETLGAEDGADEFDDFDLDSLDLSGLDLEEDAAEEEEEPGEDPAEEEPDPEELDFEDVDFEDGEELYPDDADLAADMAFTRRASFFGVDTGVLPEQPMAQEPDYEQEPDYDQEPDYGQEPDYDQEEAPAGQEGEEMPEELQEPEMEEPEVSGRRQRRARPERVKKERKPIKLTVPPVVTNLLKLYIPNQQEIHERMETGEGRRRRRPSRQQIFKEYYLPPIILGLSLVLIFSFVIGSLSNAIDSAKLKREQEQQKAQQESIAAEQLATEGQNLMGQAELLAREYDYDGAIAMLDSYQGEKSQDMIAKRAEYVNAKSMLVEHQDPTLIPNLSFHVLIADMQRAIADQEFGGQYNRNFVSAAEFEKILNQLYLNNYVLVNFDSFVAASSMDGTTEVYDEKPILLPEGKKPVMITETMVNYFQYMVDPNKDGVPDSNGAGFACRLVVDDNGDIKAEYVDENNVTQVGDYDLVPILEKFIAEHPDFSYRGARATLAVSGSEGIFGYRIQSETIANKGQDYYNEQVVGATKVVNALREKGYRLACYSFANQDYFKMSANMINEDIQKWKSQIAPVIGEIDTIVFARGTDIGDYTGGKFEVLHAAGFRYMLSSAETPYTEINNTFIKQARLMVTGENMVSKSSMFTGNGLFDPNTVLDLATRGNVPVG